MHGYCRPNVHIKCEKSPVEQGIVFYLIPPSHVSIQEKNQNGTMAKDALFMEKFVSAECVRWKTRLRELL